jgi:hypothetical protein
MGYIIKILICVHIPLKITPESTKTLYCPPMQFANMLPDSLLWPSGGEDLSPLTHARNNNYAIYQSISINISHDVPCIAE